MLNLLALKLEEQNDLKQYRAQSLYCIFYDGLRSYLLKGSVASPLS